MKLQSAAVRWVIDSEIIISWTIRNAFYQMLKVRQEIHEISFITQIVAAARISFFRKKNIRESEKALRDVISS